MKSQNAGGIVYFLLVLLSLYAELAVIKDVLIIDHPTAADYCVISVGRIGEEGVLVKCEGLVVLQNAEHFTYFSPFGADTEKRIVFNVIQASASSVIFIAIGFALDRFNFRQKVGMGHE